MSNTISTTKLNRISTDEIEELLKCREDVFDVFLYDEKNKVGKISQTLPDTIRPSRCKELVFGTFKGRSKAILKKPVLVVFGKSKDRHHNFKFYYY